MSVFVYQPVPSPVLKEEGKYLVCKIEDIIIIRDIFLYSCISISIKYGY